MKELRKRIDKIDESMVSLFHERMECAKEVAYKKLEVNQMIYDANREQEKRRMVCSGLEDVWEQQSISELYQHIMTLSRQLQCRIQKKEESLDGSLLLQVKIKKGELSDLLKHFIYNQVVILSLQTSEDGCLFEVRGSLSNSRIKNTLMVIQEEYQVTCLS